MEVDEEVDVLTVVDVLVVVDVLDDVLVEVDDVVDVEVVLEEVEDVVDVEVELEVLVLLVAVNLVVLVEVEVLVEVDDELDVLVELVNVVLDVDIDELEVDDVVGVLAQRSCGLMITLLPLMTGGPRKLAMTEELMTYAGEPPSLVRSYSSKSPSPNVTASSNTKTTCSSGEASTEYLVGLELMTSSSGPRTSA
mmetsp:Transcript_62097/g.148114  ORF Transcript_62097/g.148114 Transcript_62097/m.148114 type:complete len:194 (-) Transcript_62097:177-758(-)